MEMTKLVNDIEWDLYEVRMRQWEEDGRPQGRQPHLPIQIGTHIDSLPVKINEPGTVNMPVLRS